MNWVKKQDTSCLLCIILTCLKLAFYPGGGGEGTSIQIRNSHPHDRVLWVWFESFFTLGAPEVPIQK